MSPAAPHLQQGAMAQAVLRDGPMRVTLLGHGAITQDWRLDDMPLILGFRDPENYRRDGNFLGAIVGRVANRIGGARYRQDGREVVLAANDGPHQLHGGPQGLWCAEWEIDQPDARTARLTHVSPEGASGFPGRIRFELTVTLTAPRLTYDMRAVPDCETPISLAQHNYYSLGSATGIRDHRLWLNAPRMLARDRDGIMTGAIRPVADTRFDFRTPRILSTADPAAQGIDDFLLFDPARDPDRPVAELTAPNGLRLRLWSDQPGAQVYTGHGLHAHDAGLAGQTLGPFAGLCIEPSGYPNALNCPGFPSILHSPDRPYRQAHSVEIARAAAP